MGSCGTTNGSLTVNKTVRNITNGNAFSTSTYANPSDMLMFMITLRATNGDVQNIIVRDHLPYNLIYKNQLVVACTTNNCGSNYNNYSADISSGINIGTINAGQTVTITYQTQVASAEIFPYGTTTLNNSATATGSQGGTTPMSTALVYVTKNAVLGASSVSTGLTNNFLTDSFIFPLIMLLGGILMWKSGMLLGIEIWLAKKIKKTSI